MKKYIVTVEVDVAPHVRKSEVEEAITGSLENFAQDALSDSMFDDVDAPQPVLLVKVTKVTRPWTKEDSRKLNARRRASHAEFMREREIAPRDI